MAAPSPSNVVVGDMVRVQAVDWALYAEQLSPEHEFSIVTGTIYGQVVAWAKGGIVIAPQVFESGDVRYAITIPFVCIETIDILQVRP